MCLRGLILMITLVCSLPLLFAQRQDNPISQDLRWRNIGPANMMGRIAAIDALDHDYRQVVVASASGGVFKSSNAGLSWTPIFDRYGAGSIGSVTINQKNPDIIWVGTGESANRNSSGWGDGIYKSTDGGKTFQHMGLTNTYQIKTIAIHPDNPDIVYAAAIGNLWGYQGERGLFKTTDGGKSWTKLTNGLPNDGKTGCSDIVLVPGKPNILFAGMYHRLRQPDWFHSGGPNGGLFQSLDGGLSWKKITAGLAKGETGNIDISIHKKDPRIMVMTYEADEKLPVSESGSGVYRSDDGGKTWKFLLKHAVRPYYHGQIEIDPVNPNKIYVVSREFYISNDGGKSFHERRARTDGGDDHDLWIATHDPKYMYLATDQGCKFTNDGGKSFLSFNNMAIGQYYAIGTDLSDPYRVIGGLQDNALWLSTTNSREPRGIFNEHHTWLGEGDGFHAQIDPLDNNTAYIVNHVGFAARIDLTTRQYQYITPTPETVSNFNDYFDPNYPGKYIRYTIDPGEHWFYYERLDRTPLPPQFRFNWSSPLVLSPHNPHTVYFGGNHLFKSVDQGRTWRIISPDLSKNVAGRTDPSLSGGLTRTQVGEENHYTIITIAESPLIPELIWVGTDDGNVQITRNGGATWTNVKPSGLPVEIWVSRVEPSHHDPGTCYVTFDNHRQGDFAAYVFKTSDYGRTWTDISANLNDKYSVYVIREDPVNKNLLFVGTEEGVQASIDGGASWFELMAHLPTVAVHDLIIHPREGDLIAGTHGRSIWILDDLSALRRMTTVTMNRPLFVPEPRLTTKWQDIQTGRKQPLFEFRGENPPAGALIHFWLKSEPTDSVVITVKETFGDKMTSWKVKGHQGLNRWIWPLYFETSASDLEVYKKDLLADLGDLRKMITRPDLLDSLTRLESQLNQATNTEDFHELRKEMVWQFGGYAGGLLFFTEKLPLIQEATPGWYQVKVQSGTLEAETRVEVRADPLIKK